MVEDLSPWSLYHQEEVLQEGKYFVGVDLISGAEDNSEVNIHLLDFSISQFNVFIP